MAITERTRIALREMVRADLRRVRRIERAAYDDAWPRTTFERELGNRLAQYIVAIERAQQSDPPPPLGRDQAATGDRRGRRRPRRLLRRVVYGRPAALRHARCRARPPGAGHRPAAADRMPRAGIGRRAAYRRARGSSQQRACDRAVRAIRLHSCRTAAKVLREQRRRRARDAHPRLRTRRVRRPRRPSARGAPIEVRRDVRVGRPSQAVTLRQAQDKRPQSSIYLAQLQLQKAGCEADRHVPRAGGRVPIQKTQRAKRVRTPRYLAPPSPAAAEAPATCRGPPTHSR